MLYSANQIIAFCDLEPKGIHVQYHHLPIHNIQSFQWVQNRKFLIFFTCFT